MSAPSPLFSSLQHRLTVGSRRLLASSGILPTLVVDTVDLDTTPLTSGDATAQSNYPAQDVVDSLPTAPITQNLTATSQVSSSSSLSQSQTSDASEDIEKLALFDSILDQAEQLVMPTGNQVLQSSTTPVDDLSLDFFPAQAISQAAEDLWQQAQSSATTGKSGKESASADWSIDGAVQESGGLLMAVEQEKKPEISAEVEAYLQRVEDNQESPAKELAELIPLVASSSNQTPTEVVRVLPITKQTATVGRSKSMSFSIRWLAEWSDKLVKMFQGKIAYRVSKKISN